MRLRQIEVFHAVYVTGSVSGGARALNVSQPTVSKVLKHAEDQLGFSLFERISGRLVLTEKGKMLIEEIEPILEKMSALSQFTTRLSNTKLGRLRFAMTPAFGLEVAPEAVANFSKSNPDFSIEVETLHAAQVVKSITSNIIDLGLVFDAPKIPGIASKTLWTTEFVCAVPKSITLKKQPTISLEDLKGYPLINLSQKSVLGQILNRKLEAAFSAPINSNITVETYHIAKSLARQGAGIAIIDSITAFSGDRSGLQFRKLTPAIDINVDLVSRLNEPVSRINRAFIEELKRSIQRISSKVT